MATMTTLFSAVFGSPLAFISRTLTFLFMPRSGEGDLEVMRIASPMVFFFFARAEESGLLFLLIALSLSLSPRALRPLALFLRVLRVFIYFLIFFLFRFFLHSRFFSLILFFPHRFLSECPYFPFFFFGFSRSLFDNAKLRPERTAKTRGRKNARKK